MDRDHLIDLFSEFGPITLRRMFSGYGITADGVNFAMALRGGIVFRVDDQTVPHYEAEGARPFQYQTRSRTVVVQSYWHLPERLYDDPEELALWAREAVQAAKRAALKKSVRKKSAVKKDLAAKTVKSLKLSKTSKRQAPQRPAKRQKRKSQITRT